MRIWRMELQNTKNLVCRNAATVYTIRVNLQLFAEGEKTEKATPKKRQDARKKGQVLQSKEITAALILICIFIGIQISGAFIYSEISDFIKRIFNEYAKLEGLFTLNMLTRLFADTAMVLLKSTAPVFGIAVITGLIAAYSQVGFLFTLETLEVKLERINPLKGLKRIFSMRALAELAKSVLKVGIMGYIAYSYLSEEVNNVLSLMRMDVMSIAMYIGSTALNVAVRICVVLILLAILDYFYQWWEFEKNMKMSKQEVKEEYKQIEGNPEIKSKIKQKQRQMSMKRMLHEVPKADVVITNPTHFAVAVRYDAQVASAPVVLAKGQDFMAMRIREIARENKVEIVENKPLARSLYETVDIGEAIPPELYQAVAEVLAFVYSLKNKAI
ncbi:MAG: flagellar biosynthesis protein FlhB [Clostridia bacterium]|nr:flagellar biosynthesis protein FlhB [Clostridia bacterium]